MAKKPMLRRQGKDGVVTLIFNRANKLNALNDEMLDEFERQLDSIAGDPGVKVVLLRGAGAKAFVAGADIEGYQGRKVRKFAAYQRRGRRIFDKLENLDQPTMAVVDGYALGGGFEIALCCDIIICTHEARFGLPEVRLGLCPGGGGTVRLARAVGKQIATEVALAGWRLHGNDALQIGLACDCVFSHELEDAVKRRVSSLLKGAPLAQARIKRLIREGLDMDEDTAKDVEQKALLELYKTKDAQEGIDAFLEKRDPVYKGQ